MKIDEALANLTTEVELATTRSASVSAYIRGVPDLIMTAVQQALDAGLTQDQVEIFANLASQIDAGYDDIEAAIEANTAPEPEPEPTPEPTPDA